MLIVIMIGTNDLNIYV